MTTISMAKPHHYSNGSEYGGSFNERGLRHGIGYILFPDKSGYAGQFVNGSCKGLGVYDCMDGYRYEGEFDNDTFNGVGVFYRADGMKFEGRFVNGQAHGLGLVTLSDGTHGAPRQEGSFQNNQLMDRGSASVDVVAAQQAAEQAREIAQQV